jgi:hypothetical protein
MTNLTRTQISCLDESTAFERYAVDIIPPRPDPLDSSTIDLRNSRLQGHTNISINVHEDTCAGAVAATLERVRPLVFGAAFKLIDLMLDLALESDGFTPPRGRPWSMAEKAAKARDGAGNLPPITNQFPELWERLCVLYAEWMEVRHSLVHRTAQVDPSTGTLTGHDIAGTPLPSISGGEQEQFVRLAVEAIGVVLQQDLSPRIRRVLAWRVNQLGSHHKLAAIKDGASPANPVRVMVNLEPLEGGRWRIDAPEIHDSVERITPSATFIDCECHVLVDWVDRVFLCDLDHVGDVVDFDLQAPPEWLVASPIPDASG